MLGMAGLGLGLAEPWLRLGLAAPLLGLANPRLGLAEPWTGLE